VRNSDYVGEYRGRVPERKKLELRTLPRASDNWEKMASIPLGAGEKNGEHISVSSKSLMLTMF